MKDLEQARLRQAREALDEARAVLEAGMDAGRVLTNLYYAYYYPVLALLNEGRVPETMQSVTLGLFERQFVETGIVARRYLEALRLLFDSKPQCSGEPAALPRGELERLLSLAQEFQEHVEQAVGRR